MKLESEIRKIATAHGIDLVGFAKVEDIQLGYPPRPAEDLLPGAKTVIVFAGALLQGALECPRGTKGAIKDTQMAYDRIQSAASAVGRFLESKRFKSYAPPASMPTDTYKHNGKSWYAGEFSHRQAAISAGLGVKGWNNLLVTPQYGPRVRLGSLITSAQLDFKSTPLQEDVCTHCGKCVEACPVKALDPHKEHYLDQPKCKNYYIRPFMDDSAWKVLKNLLTFEGFGSLGMQVLMEGYYFSCARCQAVCPVGKI